MSCDIRDVISIGKLVRKNDGREVEDVLSTTTKYVLLALISFATLTIITAWSFHLVLADPLHCDMQGWPSCYSVGYQHGLANPGTNCPSGHSDNFCAGWEAGASRGHMPNSNNTGPGLIAPIINYGVCKCVGDKLTGPQCKLAGKSCSDVKKRFAAESTCTCGPDGIATGLGCPFLGQSCMALGHTLRFPGPGIPSYSQWLSSHRTNLLLQHGEYHQSCKTPPHV
jgi:hypothetical protein